MEIQFQNKKVVNVKNTVRKLSSTSLKNWYISKKATIYTESQNLRFDGNGDVLIDIKIPKHASKEVQKTLSGTYKDYIPTTEEQELLDTSETIKYGKRIKEMDIEELINNKIIDIADLFK